MPRDDLRIMAKVADLYYNQGMKQAEISARLGVHQSSISRLLKKAEKEGIVKVSVNYPTGFYPHLESSLEETYGLKQAIIVDSTPSEFELTSRIGSAAASCLRSILKPTDTIGISSWSSSLVAMAQSLRPREVTAAKVVQILGGVGSPTAEMNATHLTKQFAQLTDGAPVLLGTPGIVPNANARDVLMAQPYAKQALDLFDDVTIALVGIGTLEPSPLLAKSGNAFPEESLARLRNSGAVGNICLRYFNKDGALADTDLNEHVIGVTLEQLKKVNTTIAIAGGMRKSEAILGALRGGWIDILVTDDQVASYICGDQAHAAA